MGVNYGGQQEGVIIRHSGAAGAPLVLDETTKTYDSSPVAGRIVGVAIAYTEATDGTPAITIKNETTSVSSTLTLATKAINTSEYKALAAEVPVSAGDLISWVSDGSGSTGQGFANIFIALGK